MSAGHSRIGPSGAKVWVHCPGSVSMEARYPELDEDHGEEGTASHHAAAEVLLNRPMPLAGALAPNGVMLTDEMTKAATVYVEAVLDQAEGAGLAVEQPVAIPAIHPECWGTPDTWYLLQRLRELHIWDYKYGWGIVEAFDNWQGVCYSSGVLDLLRQYGHMVDNVVIHIVQPRPWHVLGSVREWRVTVAELQPYIEQLRQAAAEALGPDPQCKSGVHCRYCLGRHACGAAQRTAMFSVDYIHAAVPEELSPEAIAVEWSTLKRAEEAVKHRKTGLEAQAMHLISKGVHIPGLGVEQGVGRRNWTRPAVEVFALGDMYKIELRKPAEPCTPTEAKNKKLPFDIIQAFSAITPGAGKLVATGNTLAARVFGPKGVV